MRHCSATHLSCVQRYALKEIRQDHDAVATGQTVTAMTLYLDNNE